MRFVVLVKQVPAELNVSMNADFTMNRQRMKKITNPADVTALAMASEWKNRLGGEVICLTMGPQSAADSLRESALGGADALYHICDPKIAGADSFVTSTILAAAIEHIGGADVILCGNRSVDGETGQVGAELSAMLGCACMSHVTAIDDIRDDAILCTCFEKGVTEQYELRRPAVVCVCPCMTVKILPTRAALLRADRMPVEELTLKDLGLDGISGGASSPTQVAGVHQKERSRRHTAFISAAAVADVVRQLMKAK